MQFLYFSSFQTFIFLLFMTNMHQIKKNQLNALFYSILSLSFSVYETFSENTEVDLIYQVLKQAGEISSSKSRVNMDVTPPTIAVNLDRGHSASNPSSSGSSSGQSLNRRTGPQQNQPSRAQGSNLTVINPAPCSTSSGLLSLFFFSSKFYLRSFRLFMIHNHFTIPYVSK